MGLLALIPIKDWIYGGIIAALLVFGVYEKHHLIAEGQQHELAALKLSSDKLQKQTAVETAELQAKATMAEQAYDKEIQTITAQPPIGSVRLCGNSAAHRSSVMPKAGGTIAGNAAPSAASGDVQQMPSGNSSDGQSAGPDIGRLLGLLSARADVVSATLREYQAREQPSE